MEPLNVAIAGCGPCGLATALLLARAGHRVTLFERFVTVQPVGSGLILQPTGLAVLDALGLGDAARTCGNPITRLFGRAGAEGPVVLDVRYEAMGRPDAVGIGIHRAALFDLLYQAVLDAGLPIDAGRMIRSSSIDSNGQRSLCFEDGEVAGPFDLIVDALGAHTPLAPPTGGDLIYGALWATLDWVPDAGFDGTALEQRYRAASVMTGVLPIGRCPGSEVPQAAFFWSLRADRLDEWRAAGLDVWKAEVEALWPLTRPLLDQIIDPAQLTFARYAHRTVRRAAEPGLIHIGDAWHSTSPQLGQGANMALLDAFALATGLQAAASICDALAWVVWLRSPHVRCYQALSRWFTPVYQSDSTILPILRDRLVGPLAKRWPATRILAEMVSGTLGDPLGRLGLA